MKYFSLFLFIITYITLNLNAQDISNLENEYMELLKDIRRYGPQATLPYYTNSEYYYSADRYMVEVDNEFSFAILGSGFIKFEDEQGNITYSRYLWLNKSSEGYLYGASGRLADELFAANEEGKYMITAYLPKPGTSVYRNLMTIEMEEVIPVERFIISNMLNTTLIDLVYTTNRMIEILYHLKQLEPNSLRLYDFKIRTLDMLLDYIIKDRQDLDREYNIRVANNQRIIQRDFIEMHNYLELIFGMLIFLELDR